MTINLTYLRKLKAEGEKIAMLSCYDASFGALCDKAGVEVLLVGDSLGMTVQGRGSTIPVSLDDIVYHTTCVARGATRPIILADLPFGTYQVSPAQAYESAARLMAAGAHAVKLEGGAEMAETVAFLTTRGIPAMGHIGLTPQHVHALGGFRVQGKGGEDADRLVEDARVLEEAGLCALVVECVPAPLGKRITDELTIPTIGIGAGPDCSGQVLILHDMLNIYPGKQMKFVKNFMKDACSVQGALAAFVREVKEGAFPAEEHCFN